MVHIKLKLDGPVREAFEREAGERGISNTDLVYQAVVNELIARERIRGPTLGRGPVPEFELTQQQLADDAAADSVADDAGIDKTGGF